MQYFNAPTSLDLLWDPPISRINSSEENLDHRVGDNGTFGVACGFSSWNLQHATHHLQRWNKIEVGPLWWLCFILPQKCPSMWLWWVAWVAFTYGKKNLFPIIYWKTQVGKCNFSLYLLAISLVEGMSQFLITSLYLYN